MPNLYLQQADGTPVATFKLHNDFTVRAEQEEVTVLAIIPEAASATPALEPRGHDYTPCTHETDSSWWQDRWLGTANQCDDRDRCAHAWKEHSREMFRQRQDARTELARFQRLAAGWITEAQAEATEAVTRAETAELRAEKAGQERDEADRRTAEAERERDEWKRHHDRVDGQWAKAEREVTRLTRSAEQPHPLAADGVTDEMVERAWNAFWDAPGEYADVNDMRVALHAALTAAKEARR